MSAQGLVTHNSKHPWKSVKNRPNRSRIIATRMEERKPTKMKDRTQSKVLQTLIDRISARHPMQKKSTNHGPEKKQRRQKVRTLMRHPA